MEKTETPQVVSETSNPLPIILESYLSPGDIVCMTAAVRDLHENHPNKYTTEIRTAANEIWEHNHYCTDINRPDDEVEVISEIAGKNGLKLVGVDTVRKGIEKVWHSGKVPKVKIHYPLIDCSNQGPNHFTEGYTDYLESVLGIRIRKRLMKGHIELSEDEYGWVSQVQEATGSDEFYWVVVNGGKMDFTAKWWDPVRMQRVVSYFKDLMFVQIGDASHCHVELHGSNVVNLLGKTDLRQLIRLIYHSSGVICPVTLAMHLAAAVPVRKDKCYDRLTRPCVVIAGSREPAAWEAYTSHAYLHTCGMMSCGGDAGCGCWKSRVVAVGDKDDKDDSLCEQPVMTENGIVIPQCMKMITVSNVIEAVQRYLP